MPAIDTRHAEKNHLFSLLEAKRYGNIEIQISRLKASMEEEDVKQVIKEFDEYEKGGC